MIKDEETIIATIGDVTDISANLDNNESIVINPGGTADITGIVEAEEQRVQNENERISNENDRETYINDLKERVLNGEFNGQDGQPGEKGDKGDKGDTGEQGIQGIPGERGTDGTDGISPIITTSKQGKVTTLTIVDADGTHTAEILDGADGSGTGDMLKSTYDTNENGIVDNAERVNNHSVLSDVPANAVFTDTTYTAGTGIDITNGVISNTQTSANWGNITGTLSNQTDLQNALDQKANISNLSDVAISGDYDDLIDKPTLFSGNYNDLTNKPTLFSGDYDDLTNKPTIPVVPTNVSAFTNDSGYITSASLPTKTSDLTNDSGYITSASLPTKTSDLTNDSGFVTSNTTNSTLTYDPGASVVHTILRDSANNSVTADIPTASTSEAGVMSSADKTKLNGLQNYTAGDNITIENGVISSIGGGADKVGSIKLWSGTTAPNGYLLCDGSAVSRTTYSALFDMIGTTYGSGDGSTTFNVPNLKGRVAIGLDNNDADFDTLGETGGEKEHTLTISEMPSHTHGHTVRNIYITKSFQESVDAGLQVGSNGTTTATGGDQAHNILQPYVVLNYIIKAFETEEEAGTIIGSYIPIGTEVEYTGSIVPDGYEEVDDPYVYSTSEVKTNKIWIDGKPIYRRVISGVYQSGTTLVSNVSTLIHAYGCGDVGTGAIRAIPYYEIYDNRVYLLDIRKNGNNVVVNAQKDGSSASTSSGTNIIIEYTKTTD